MKSRSHRLPASETRQDEWVDGSWTVDCICGVNYDDGEEMVDCDECGVWVHTRCSRFIKSEKSYACDKCKSKNSVGAGCVDMNDSEEAEVAEFLVELPTKTLLMDNPISATVASYRPFKLWTDIPMEERVHVQGVPSGEPELFSRSGMRSIFGTQLWKSSGYVPKKFNFRYTEFPDHAKVEEKEENELNRVGGNENANQADSGAGVLYSLLKENYNTLPSQVDLVGVKSPGEGSASHDLLSLRHKKNLSGENPVFSCPEDSKKKETGSVRIVLHSVKRKKEEVEMFKNQNANKKVKTVENGGDAKKCAVNAKAASTSSSDAKHLESFQDRVSKPVSIQCDQNVLRDQQDNGLGECATNLASKEHCMEDTLRNDVSIDELSNGRNREDHVPVRSENISKTNYCVESFKEPNGSLKQPVKDEIPKDTLQSGEDTKDTRQGKSSDINGANSRPNNKFKEELDSDDLRPHSSRTSPLNDVKLENVKVLSQCRNSSVNVFSEESKVIETSSMISEASNPKLCDATRSSTSRPNKFDEPASNHSQYKRQPTVEGSTGARKKSLGRKYFSEASDQLYKSSDTAKSHSRDSKAPVKSTSNSGGNISKPSNNRPAVISQKSSKAPVKSTSTSGGNISKPSDNDNHTTTVIIQKSSIYSKQNGSSESTLPIVKDNTTADVVGREEKSGRLKKLGKEHSRHLSTIPESTKLSHTSDTKKPLFENKGSSIHSSSSSKLNLVPNVTFNHGSGEGPTGPRIESASNVRNKDSASAEPVKASTTAPTSAYVPAKLSDEELALLLHQELNSSPRVPRVPRMRNTGSLPHLAGPSATSLLMKPASSGGVKEHSVTSRRRTKDFSREVSHGSVEVDNEAMKMERKPSPSDNRRRDSGYKADSISRRETDGTRVKSVQSVKKTNVGSSLSSSADLPSSRPSSVTASDDDPCAIGRLTTRTLPGLISEIMSEGKRITYEALCKTVLPHWPHLRKHNGERYAYSSHSQAVLDCLRNRSEWARLVDRGPKTSTSRKRRKLDADSLSIESEDNEENKVKNPKDYGSKTFESYQEDFPKGKRNARNRRRVALQGTGVVRRRRADIVSDDESESFSTSREENSTSSEEDVRGGGASIGVSEASASSDEV